MEPDGARWSQVALHARQMNLPIARSCFRILYDAGIQNWGEIGQRRTHATEFATSAGYAHHPAIRLVSSWVHDILRRQGSSATLRSQKENVRWESGASLQGSLSEEKHSFLAGSKNLASTFERWVRVAPDKDIRFLEAALLSGLCGSYSGSYFPGPTSLCCQKEVKEVAPMRPLTRRKRWPRCGHFAVRRR